MPAWRFQKFTRIMSAKGKGGQDKGRSSSSKHSTTSSRGLVPDTLDSVKPTGRSFPASRNNPALPAKENDTSDTNKKMLDGVREWIKQLHKFVDSGKTDFTYPNPKIETGMTKEMTAIAKGIGQKNAYENIIKKLALSVTKANVKPEVDMETDVKLKPELDIIAKELCWNQKNKNTLQSYETTLKSLITWLDDLVPNNDKTPGKASASKTSTKDSKKVDSRSAPENDDLCGKAKILISEAKHIFQEVQERSKQLEGGITSQRGDLEAIIQELRTIHPMSMTNSATEANTKQNTTKTAPKVSKPNTPPTHKDTIDESATIIKSAKDLVCGLQQRLQSQSEELKTLIQDVKRIHPLPESIGKPSNKKGTDRSKQTKQPESPPADKNLFVENSGMIKSLQDMVNNIQAIVEEKKNRLASMIGDLRNLLEVSDQADKEDIRKQVFKYLNDKNARQKGTVDTRSREQKGHGNGNENGSTEEKALLADCADSISNITKLVNTVKVQLETKENRFIALRGQVDKLIYTWENGKVFKKASSKTSGDNEEPDIVTKLTDLIIKKEEDKEALRKQMEEFESRFIELQGQVDQLIDTWQGGNVIRKAKGKASGDNNEPDTVTKLTDLIIKKEEERHALYKQIEEIETMRKRTLSDIYITVVTTFGFEEVNEKDDESKVKHITVCLDKHKMEEANMIEVSQQLEQKTKNVLTLLQGKPYDMNITTATYERFAAKSQYPKKYESIYESLCDAMSVSEAVDSYGKTLTGQWNENKLRLMELQEQNDELSTRLSKLAGAALRHNNPDIADLSDQNRPTKLAEQFSELYDNSWTDAFDELEKKHGDDEQAIADLLRILRDAYLFCKRESEKQAQLFENILLRPVTFDEQDERKKAKNPELHLRPDQATVLSDLRKGTAGISVRNVKQIFQELNNQYFSPKGSKLQKYSEECVKVCWHMNLQAPPVVIDTTTKSGDKMDKDRYKAYTKDGKKIKYVVWPAVYLHKGGSLLGKGVAQGK